MDMDYGIMKKACSAPFDSKGKSHVDGGHHGDGVEGEEKVWDEKEMESGAENGETKKGLKMKNLVSNPNFLIDSSSMVTR